MFALILAVFAVSAGAVMDMTQLSFADSTFDVVVDKCAMDALLVDEGESSQR